MDKNIEIYIDRIVLEGLEHLNKAELNAVIQERLTTLIAEQGLSGGLVDVSYHRKLNGGEMNLSSLGKNVQVGNGIAGGIFNGINSVE